MWPMGLVFLLISESGDITPNTDSSNKIEEMHSHKDFDSGKLVKNILLKHFIQETFNICTVSFLPLCPQYKTGGDFQCLIF